MYVCMYIHTYTHACVSTLICPCIYNVIYEAICFDAAQSQMNGAPNETRTHSCRFTSQAC